MTRTLFAIAASVLALSASATAQTEDKLSVAPQSAGMTYRIAEIDHRTANNAQSMGETNRAHRFYAKARTGYDSACAGGEAKACAAAADMHRRGQGGAQDFAKAKRGYEAGCAGRIANGCAGLGYMYNKGLISGSPDITRATEAYKKACDLQSVNGCAAYGNLVYVSARTTSQRDRGAAILNAACDKDFEWACQRIRDIGITRRKGTGAYN